MAFTKQSLPVLYVVGTHYEIGYSIGDTFSQNIKSFFQESVAVSTIDIPFHNSPEGRAFFETSLNVCKRHFPQYIQELEGMAAGAGIAFDELFMLNISKEVHNVLAPGSLKKKKIKETAGCSDIFVNTPTCKILAHNEDCDPSIKLHGYIVVARIVAEDGSDLEDFTAYCYPGCLPGTTLSFNRHGMVFTVDGLYPDFAVIGAAPRMFLNRSIIKARTLEEAVELCKNKGCGLAYAFAVNIVDVKNPTDMWSIELGPDKEESMYHVHTVGEEADVTKTCHYIHINSFKHLNTSEIPNLTSSIARTKAAEGFPPPKNRDDIMAILGDQSNEEYPIYRTERPTDHSATAFTGVVDVLRKRVDIYVVNPAQKGISPLLHFNLLDD